MLVDPTAPQIHHIIDGIFEETEADAVDEEDVLEDGTEMMIDTQPLNPIPPPTIGPGASTVPMTIPLPPVPPLLSPNASTDPRLIPSPSPGVEMEPFNYVGSYPPYVPQHFGPQRGGSGQEIHMEGSSPVDSVSGAMEDRHPAASQPASQIHQEDHSVPHHGDYMEGLLLSDPPEPPQGPQAIWVGAAAHGDASQNSGPTMPGNNA